MRTYIALLFSLLICNGTPGQGNNVRDKVALTYLSQIGVKEATGHNDGPEVESYLRSVDLAPGAPWCAAFVSWTYTKNGIKNPRSAWSPVYFPSSKVIYTRDGTIKAIPQKADVFGIYFANLGRIAHVGFIHFWGSRLVETVEGNTNDAGSREGTRVASKRRPTRTIYKVSRYIN
jgi:hypothetical protein